MMVGVHGIAWGHTTSGNVIVLYLLEGGVSNWMFDPLVFYPASFGSQLDSAFSVGVSHAVLRRSMRRHRLKCRALSFHVSHMGCCGYASSS
jgi:hypothetical protein